LKSTELAVQSQTTPAVSGVFPEARGQARQSSLEGFEPVVKIFPVDEVQHLQVAGVQAE